MTMCLVVIHMIEENGEQNGHLWIGTRDLGAKLGQQRTATTVLRVCFVIGANTQSMMMLSSCCCFCRTTVFRLTSLLRSKCYLHRFPGGCS